MQRHTFFIFETFTKNYEKLRNFLLTASKKDHFLKLREKLESILKAFFTDYTLKQANVFYVCNKIKICGVTQQSPRLAGPNKMTANSKVPTEIDTFNEFH